MLFLKQTQNKFYQAVFDNKSSLDFIHSKNSTDRFAIYRHNIFENLRKHLAHIFPGIWILLGEACANSAALAFIKNPEHTKEKFPDFLMQQSEFAHLPYLKDYAQYELRVHGAYKALQIPGTTYSNLENISEDKLEKIRFKFLPSVFLYASQFPIDQIKYIIDNPDASAINLEQDPKIAVIAKLNHQVFTFFVEPDMGLFLNALYQGLTLAQAAQHIDNLTHALYFLIKHKLIQEII
ncbi:MAG: putative DNA-binding domain-containing protein [Legionellales bacterium]|jgi:hypothetical protein